MWQYKPTYNCGAPPCGVLNSFDSLLYASLISFDRVRPCWANTFLSALQRGNPTLLDAWCGWFSFGSQPIKVEIQIDCSWWEREKSEKHTLLPFLCIYIYCLQYFLSTRQSGQWFCAKGLHAICHLTCQQSSRAKSYSGGWIFGHVFEVFCDVAAHKKWPG